MPDNDAPTDAFDALVSGLEYPMFIVTTAADGVRAGCLAGFVTQCSIDPPALLVCLSKNNMTYRVAAEAPSLAVHFLGAGDLNLARLFGAQTGDSVDKFSRCDWQPGRDGVPILSRCRGWSAGPVLARMDMGDHVGFVVGVTSASAPHASLPQLGFRSVKDIAPGHPA